MDEPRVFGRKFVVQRKERLYREEKMQGKKMRVDEDELTVRHANQGCRQGCRHTSRGRAVYGDGGAGNSVIVLLAP